MGPSGGWNFSNIACIDTQPSFQTFSQRNISFTCVKKLQFHLHYLTLAQVGSTLNKSVKSKVKVLRPHFLVFTQVSSFWKLFISFPLSVAKFATGTMQAFSGSEYLPDISRKCPTFEARFLWKAHLLLGQRNQWWRVKNCVTSSCRSHWFLLRLGHFWLICRTWKNSQILRGLPKILAVKQELPSLLTNQLLQNLAFHLTQPFCHFFFFNFCNLY